MNVTAHAPWLKRLPPTLYKLAAQAWVDYKYPRHLFVETTSSCNLACTYCPREARIDHMAWNLFCQIIDEASQYGPRSFSTHLFGEPTLYPRWTDTIHYIKSKNHRHTVLLTTNGTTLNRRVDDLISANPDQVLWTWRPEAQFTSATKEKLRRWGKFRVRFIHEVTPPEAYEEWKEWPNVEGRPLHNYGGEISLDQFRATSAGANVDDDVQGMVRRIRPSGGIADSPGHTATRWPCYHLWLAPAVAWNGNILLCCADPHQKEVLGTFPQMTVAQAWQSERLQAIRHGHLRGDYKGICATCDVWKQYPDLFFPWQTRASTQRPSST